MEIFGDGEGAIDGEIVMSAGPPGSRAVGVIVR